MEDIMSHEFEKAKDVFQNFMCMVENDVSWPAKDLIRYFSEQFSGVIDCLYEEQVCLMKALQVKNERLRYLEATESSADEWAELEEI